MFDSGIDWVRENVMGRCIDLLLQWRYLFVGCVSGLFLVSVAMVAGGVLKMQGFPELDGDVIVARVLFPQGTPLKRTEEVVEQITDAIDRVDEKFTPRQPGNQQLVQTVTARFNENEDAFEAGPHVATVYVDLLTADVRASRLDDILREWREETGPIAGALNLTFAEPTFGPAGRPIEMRLQGEDLDGLKDAATELTEFLSRFDGVQNLSDDLRPGKAEIRIRLREGAVGLGLHAQTMARQLRSAFQGVSAGEVRVGSESYEIDVRLNPKGQDSLSDLEDFQFTLADGKKVPLGAVATVQYSRGRSRIARINGMRTVTVRGEVDTQKANTAQLIAKVKSDFLPQFKEARSDIRVSFEGEPKETGITQHSMMRGLAIGLLGVFVLLSLQFRSYIEPLIVMIAIPLALIGVIWGHLIMGVELSMPSILGFTSLAGVVVNDSILLVLFLKKQRQEGKGIEDSAAQASRQRFRAILLTSLTTIAGLLPLLAERSLQAQVLIPLAISIAFGLMASTVLVLMVIPCLYVILGDLGLVTLPATKE